MKLSSTQKTVLVSLFNGGDYPHGLQTNHAINSETALVKKGLVERFDVVSQKYFKPRLTESGLTLAKAQ